MVSNEKPAGGSNIARGIYLSVEDIERLTKAFQTGIKPAGGNSSESLRSNCGIAICGNGAAI